MEHRGGRLANLCDISIIKINRLFPDTESESYLTHIAVVFVSVNII